MEHVLPRQRRPPGVSAAAVSTSRSLSPSVRHLFDDMWRMGYGTIRGARVRDGDLLLDPPYIPVRKARLSEEPWSRCGSAHADYALKREHIRFLEELTAIGSGVVDVKVVKGLPIDLDIHEQP